MIGKERTEEIVNMYYNDIYCFCLSRLKKEHDAEDTTQDVFLFFQEKCHELEDHYIKTWLFSVANNKIKEKFKDIARREKALIWGDYINGKSVTEITTEIEYDDLITETDIENKKADILASLNDKELKLFEMVYTKHLEYSYLAETLGISENAVRIRICRLNAKIKSKILYAFMSLLLIFMKV